MSNKISWRVRLILGFHKLFSCIFTSLYFLVSYKWLSRFKCSAWSGHQFTRPITSVGNRGNSLSRYRRMASLSLSSFEFDYILRSPVAISVLVLFSRLFLHLLKTFKMMVIVSSIDRTSWFDMVPFSSAAPRQSNILMVPAAFLPVRSPQRLEPYGVITKAYWNYPGDLTRLGYIMRREVAWSLVLLY